MTRDRTRLTTAVLALVVVLAGCGAPVAQSPVAPSTETPPTASPSTPTPPNANSQSITVRNGSLSVDPDAVFERVQALQGTDVDPPRVIRAYNSIEAFRNRSRAVGTDVSRRFYTLAGMADDEVNVTERVTRQKNGYVTGLGSIVLFVGENASTVEELLLVAHELTHYVQLQTGRQQRLIEAVGGAATTDQRYAVRAVIEGGAVVTTNAYLDAYADTSVTNSEMYTGLQSALPDGHIAAYENSKYVTGDAYMDSRSDTPSDLAAVYDSPPTTSEQLLHRLPPDAEPPTPLSVTVETGEPWVTSGADRMGEAFVRTALEGAVGPERAAAAAAGWGNDTVRFLRPTDGAGETAFVWTLRFDDATNQSEFQTAYRGSLDQRGTRIDDRWTLDDNVSAGMYAPTDRTSVVVFGPQSLVETVSASGGSGEVTVSTLANSPDRSRANATDRNE
jgi:hypothetical protein